MVTNEVLWFLVVATIGGVAGAISNIVVGLTVLKGYEGTRPPLGRSVWATVVGVLVGSTIGLAVYLLCRVSGLVN